VRVRRCFGFLDLCGFTAFNERHGDERTVLVLAELRTTMREVAARRGVRVVKWLGDGAMVSSTMVDAVAGLVLEVRHRLGQSATALQLRVGLDCGPVIMFEGDDYIGRSVNRASRLCDAAGEGQVLATAAVAASLPAWVDARPVRIAALPGFERPTQVVELGLAPADGEMVTDPVCGLTIPKSRAVASPSGDLFCSVACAGIEPGVVAG
jgi:class 3 adenylate cyclase